MNETLQSDSAGVVASLHLHPPEPGQALSATEAIEVIAGKGILGEPRYYGRTSSDTGQPSPRQVSLIEREQIAQHAAGLGLPSIPPGAVRANIETVGVKLIDLIGREIRIGDAVLFLYEPRQPCAKMDAVCQGLRERMMNDRQGAMAKVVKSGKIRVGDGIQVES